MELLQNILLISSCFLLITLAVHTGRKLSVTGMPALFAMIIFFMIWVVGNIIESNVSTFDWMLWGRNFQQIGVFFTTLCTLYFSIYYTANKKLRPLAYAITVIQVISVLLIFTDQFHHLMRASVELQQQAVFGHALVVHSTALGTVLVAFNFCIPLIALAILVLFARFVSSSLRRQLWLIIISIFLTFVVAVVQSTVLSDMNINIPIPVLNLPCVILMSYAVLRGGFVGIAPTALNKVFEVIEQGIIVTDGSGTIVEFNKRAAELMRAVSSPDRLKIGSPVSGLLPDAPEPSVNQRFSPGNLPRELTDPRRTISISMAHHKLVHSGRRSLGYVLVLTDITRLKERAEIDSLTGIFNRDGIQSAFNDMQKKASGNPLLCAMIIDMDRFKTINDTYGHFGGDSVLRDFVKAAQAVLQEGCVLGRLGGDEFVVLMFTNIEDAFAHAENLRRNITERCVPYLEHKIRYTVSIGVAGLFIEGILMTDLLHKADLALYKSKHQGRNKTSV